MIVQVIGGKAKVIDETAFRRIHKGVSFPPGELPADLLAEYGAYPLRLEDEPPPRFKQRSVRKVAPVFVSGEWVHGWDTIVDPITPNDLRLEANRRILAIIPDWKQRNLIAQATQLLHKGSDNWTKAEKAAWAAGDAIWAQVSAIRTASNEIEALDPIPSDFYDDKHWP